MQVKCIFFDCDGTLVDSEKLCAQAYVNAFARYDIHCELQAMFEKYKGVKLYDIIADVCATHHKSVSTDELEAVYRQETARLFDLALRPIAGAQDLLKKIIVPMGVVSNGTVKKMQHSLGLTGLLPFFGDRLYSGFDIGHWKPDPTLIQHAAAQMQVSLDHCILVDDSQAGIQAGIAAGIPAFYYCADAHNPAIDHPLVSRFEHLSELPALWKARGWSLTH